MTPRQRRDLLQSELGDLVETVASYGTVHASATMDNPLLVHLIAQMKEKTAELNALNAYVDAPLYRFWEACHGFLLIIWITAAMVCAAALFLLVFPLIAAPWVTVLSVAAAVLCLAWAVWSSRSLCK